VTPQSGLSNMPEVELPSTADRNAPNARAREEQQSSTTVETVEMTTEPLVSVRGAVLVPPAVATVETVEIPGEVPEIPTGDAGVDSEPVEPSAEGGEPDAETAATEGADAKTSDETASAAPLDLGSDSDIWKASNAIWVSGDWSYADRAQGRVFMITSDLVHPDDGRELLSVERVEQVIKRKGNLRTGWIIHDRDPYVDEDLVRNPRAILGQIKPTHIHAVEERRNVTTVAQVARAYRIPPNFIKVGKGHGAFLDFAEYLTHESEKEQAKGKFLYPDGDVHANFDFRLEVNEHVAARKAGIGGSGSKFQREVNQALLDVLEGRKEPEDVRVELPLVYAKYHQKLKDLHHDYLARDENRPQVGSVFTKATVAILGPSRSGKGLLADDLRDETVALALAAGQQWNYAQPAGRNALEGIGTAQIVHHDDARHWMLPTYDEWLRYLDPNRATEVATRFKNRPPVAPRVIMASTSQTLLSLALTALLQKLPAELAETADKRRPVNIDEFLLRIGWVVNVSKPAGVTDPTVIRDEMLVTVARITEGEEPRIQGVHDGDGLYLGDITTRHEVESVAMIKGAERAARFLAVSIIAECSPDVAAVIPGDVLGTYQTVVQGVVEDEKQRREGEQQRRENELAVGAQKAAEREEAAEVRRLIEAEAIRLERELCSCPEFPPIYFHTRHEDTCPALPSEERERRAQEKQWVDEERDAKRERELAFKLEKVRKNGLLLELPE
jgi:hypothetical protein